MDSQVVTDDAKIFSGPSMLATKIKELRIRNQRPM